MDELVLRNYHSVIRRSLDDNALLNAFMLTLASSVSSWRFDRRYLTYQSEVLRAIRERIAAPYGATTESTLGAILLVAGVEVCNPARFS